MEGLCSEAYYIDGNRVLLYKIINWWNDCLPGDSDLLCGSSLTYNNKEEIQLQYDMSGGELTLKLGGSFPELLSMFKVCDQCSAPTLFQPILINKDYLGESKPQYVDEKNFASGNLSITGMDEKHIYLLQRIKKDLSLEIEGPIGGLLLSDGRIALHQSGDFLRSCSKQSGGQNNGAGVMFRIKDARTDEVIVEYTSNVSN